MTTTTLDRFIQDISVRAGKIIKRQFGIVTTGQQKTSQHDIVTEVDYASERLLISAIRRRFPYHSILSEEAGELTGRSDYTWIIDPLDGTANFARGVPLFGVCVALAKGNVITHGVIYDPIHDELFFAKRGAGSFCNGKRIHVSSETQLEEMVVYISNIRHRSSLERFAHWRALLALYTTYYKSYGSAAQAMASLASGRIDTYIIAGAYPWDIAAGALLLREAGGKITRLDGSSWQWRDTNQQIVTANPTLHRKIIQLLNQ
ncbi:MAG: inositol monophosphatase [Candidatus Kerfeldbacteria bacterium]|nr:inositol monophosphatase [Candidatus Kerfeldbacteria bacterium]